MIFRIPRLIEHVTSIMTLVRGLPNQSATLTPYRTKTTSYSLARPRASVPSSPATRCAAIFPTPARAQNLADPRNAAPR